MGFKLFDGIFERNLVDQMRNMIFSLSEEKDKWGRCSEITGRSLFRKREEEPTSMEEAYGLRYPGEVLERYADKIGDTDIIRRSLAFAVAEMKPLITKSMFVGKQFESFLTSLRKADKGDIYLLGARYLLADSASQKHVLRIMLMEHSCKDIAELVYCYYLFGEEPSFQKTHHPMLIDFLGDKRDFSVYGNEELFEWLIRRFSGDLRGLKGRQTNLLRAIAKLHSVNVEAKNPVKKWMLDAGYKEDEVVYLNMVLAVDLSLPGNNLSDITLERMAVSTCTRFLNGDTQRAEEIYGLCDQLLILFRHYSVKINGFEGIAGSLKHRIQVQTVDAFMILFAHRMDFKNECFCFNILDHKWDDLKKRLDIRYEEYVVNSFISLSLSKEELQKSMERYQELTGNDLYQRFWKVDSYAYRALFGRLVDNELIDIVSLANNYFMEYKKADTETEEINTELKWRIMRAKMRDYLFKKRGERLYTVLQMVDEQFGIEQLNDVFDDGYLFERTFGIESYNHYGDLKLFQDNYSLEQNLYMLQLAEKYVYYSNPINYESFLVSALLKLDCGDNPDKPLTDIVRQLLVRMELNEYDKKQLIKKYCTAEELNVYETEKARISLQEEREKERIRTEKLLDEFKRFVEDYRKDLPCSFSNLLAFADREKEKYLSGHVAEYMHKEYGQGSVVITEKNKVSDYLSLLSKLYRQDKFSLDDVKEFVQRMEVCENV